MGLRVTGDYQLWFPMFCSASSSNHTLRRGGRSPSSPECSPWHTLQSTFPKVPLKHHPASLLSALSLSLCATFLSSSERRCRERPTSPSYFPPFHIPMASSTFSFGVLTFLPTLIITLLMSSLVHAQSPAPAPTSDGTAIDQGIAYALMFLALVLTYLIHSADVSGLGISRWIG